MDTRPVGAVKSRLSRRDDYLQSNQKAKNAYINYLRAYRKEAGTRSLKDIAKDAARRWRLMSKRSRASYLPPETDFQIKCVPCGNKKKKRGCKKKRRSCKRKRRRSSCGRRRRRSSCGRKRRKSACKKKRRRKSKSPCPCPS